ncbi:SAV1978 family virulence-associated passenger protein [Mammaliicoccus sciuri]|uniref:SAV1978 family virulence-associated passenger protein n=1 Tax=Mammaliicoccus sciuri TaxID=1296 RepID=UPI001FB2AAA6|nr:SAV1978 family virulence-associated passenger protein [Mammaliicoccus sciuri]MCJ0913252.1 SAV1978 family virulence-associated passenger protein [Mammaliicoccus sciuri]
MRAEYFKNKYYLIKDNQRIAHVHIVDGTYKVCGHYKKFKEFKHREFNKETFEQFKAAHDLKLEEELGLQLDIWDVI